MNLYFTSGSLLQYKEVLMHIMLKQKKVWPTEYIIIISL